LCGFTVAFLVLLSTPAETRIVAANFRLIALVRCHQSLVLVMIVLTVWTVHVFVLGIEDGAFV
jgi:hypothetical protein